jgi:hypothetical protein
MDIVNDTNDDAKCKVGGTATATASKDKTWMEWSLHAGKPLKLSIQVGNREVTSIKSLKLTKDSKGAYKIQVVKNGGGGKK